MRTTACTLLGVALFAVFAPTAAAEQLNANVVAWSPNDVRPGAPVSVVFDLYPVSAWPYVDNGDPVPGVKDVELVIRSAEQARRFATQKLGDGRYRTEIAFPELGGWHLRVSYAAGPERATEEILLGKGAVCVRCVRGQADESIPPRATGRPWAVRRGAGLVLVVVVVATVIRRGRRFRPWSAPRVGASVPGQSA